LKKKTCDIIIRSTYKLTKINLEDSNSYLVKFKNI